ncbi:radical SAM additional 4Fe4S-binding SPASM domain-containing protein [Clostridium acidisoli DSM 12555]|uniref:Radical SAM additional 4Fe4S-binding SPASM domain-containing protein n=1 Tax=Clostridium acidisoli DSM 12555 TaxID=1121291 RepID=A0A1W1XWW6_9CLOT|nr:radical SAM/SPASM domain-containing protein [Clostridium acidisoli]SMC28021.1 radical SAM additional 4Fe4S-binding SPASM domain-containing protein [Clostridium acidisoli DSM 12555]
MKKFKKTYIEITNVCNLNCDFCPKSARHPEFMKIQLFEKILNQIKDYSNHIYFHVKGEPTMHPDLEAFLHMANAHGYKVNLTTNGTLLNSTKNMLLNKPALRQINFSLHSFDANEKTTTMKDYLDEILNFAKETSLNTNIISALRLWNLSEDNNINLSEEHNRHILKQIEEAFNLDYMIKEKLGTQRGIKLSHNVYLNQASRFNWPDLNETQNNLCGFCYGLRDQIAILVDGTVVPCCLDGEGIINLGNINHTKFEDIIENDRANALYDGFSNRNVVEPLCQKCDYRRRFNL